MGRKKRTMLYAIAGDVEEVFEDIAGKVSIELKNELQGAYESSIWAFYNDYKPKYYKRTESLFEASNLISMDDRYKVDYDPTDSKAIIARLVVDPNNISGNPYNAKLNSEGNSKKENESIISNRNKWVFERSFEKGIHGSTYSEKRRWGNNEYWDSYLRFLHPGRYREDRMVNQYKAFRYIAKKETGNDLGISDIYRIFGIKRKKRRAIVFDSANYYRSIMRGKKPKDIMDAEFKRIKSPKNVKKKIDSYLIFYLAKKGY